MLRPKNWVNTSRMTSSISSGDRMLQASLVNALRGLVWGMSDKKKRGPAPKPIGPEWALKGVVKTLPAVAMAREQLLAELAKPRKAVM